jgi:hypothetical protein
MEPVVALVKAYEGQAAHPRIGGSKGLLVTDNIVPVIDHNQGNMPENGVVTVGQTAFNPQEERGATGYAGTVTEVGNKL